MSIEHLINANTHRFKEGARVLEDLARFVLKNEDLFKQVRELRHSLKSSLPVDITQQDLGGPSLVENNIRSNLMDLVQANTVRMEESLRVLEEVSPENKEKQRIKLLRYSAYEIHQTLYKAFSMYVKQDKLKGLYLIIDTDIIKMPMKTIAKIINKTSVNLIQFRNKSLSKRDFLQNVIQFKRLLNSDKLLIINDHLDIALDIADGVHLGQTDYPLERARALVPDDFLIGITCHNIKEAKAAVKAGASYLSIGCIFPTSSKKDAIATSLTQLASIRQEINIPICATGGINTQNLTKVISCNVDMVALISSIWSESDPAHTIALIQKQFGRKPESNA